MVVCYLYLWLMVKIHKPYFPYLPTAPVFSIRSVLLNP